MSDDYYRDQDRRYEDRRYEDRRYEDQRRHEEQSRRSSEMMDALRQRDYDTATRNAAPDLYLEYLQQRDGAASVQPEYVTDSPEVRLLTENHELSEYVQQNVSNQAVRSQLLQMLAVMNPFEPGGAEQMAGIRAFAEMVVRQENAGL